MNHSTITYGAKLSVAMFALAAMLVILAPSTGSFHTSAQKRTAAPLAIIYDNGPLATGANSFSGVAAPAGTQWTEDANPYGSTQEANTLAGVSCSVTATVFRCADDFNVPVGQTWTINQVIVFAYQTGFVGATSPIAAATLQIWRGRPGDAGSVLVFGDTTTNRLATSTNSNLFRTFSSVVGVGINPPTVPATNRIVWQNNITVAPAAVLTAGNYWVDWNTRIGTTTAHFSPPSTFVGTRNTPGSNSRQFTGASWVDVVDAGQFPTGAPVPPILQQDFPFKLDGVVSGAALAPASRSIDFDGDNRTDFSVVRSADAVSQSTWWTKNSGGTQSVQPFGIGSGFALGDKVTPADFDGDGRTDIAIWRPGPAPTAKFYILQSGTSTVREEQFGQTGDDTSVVDDYDGDGKADPAVYRPGASGTFYYRGSLVNPGGNVTFIPWGGTGDIAIPGDYDGDGKADFNIMRNNAGSAEHWRRLSAGGSSTTLFGVPTDKFVTGDFDGDGKSDLAAVRTNGTSFDWYILRSSTGTIWLDKFGNPTTDILVPGDYDGDNETDLAVWRTGQAADQTYFFARNTNSSPMQVEWGQSAGSLTSPDYPVANWNVK